MFSRRAFVAAATATALTARRAAALGRAIVAPITVARSRVVLALTIAGKGPFDFLIDTGAYANGIAPDLASTLGLKSIGHNQSRGIGGRVTAASFRAPEVVYGGAIRQPGVVFDALPNVFRDGISGLLAAGLLTARDSDLDFAAGEWRVYPEGRGDWEGYTALDSDIRGETSFGGSQKIYVMATLDGVTLKLLVDTGAPSELLLFPRGTAKTGLWTGTGPYAPIQLRGIAGTEEEFGRLVRGSGLTVGPLDIARPLVRIYDPAVTRRDAADGLLGLSAIYRLNLSTDVRGNRLWVQPNGLPRPRDRYRMTGMWLDRLDGDRARVVLVSPKSPASDAGIKVGDVLNGIPDFRVLNGEAGGKIEIGTPAGPRVLTLRDYL